MDSNHLGTYAEYLFASECIKRGYSVSFPLMDSSPYDCVVDYKGRLIKVQVKSTEKKPLKHRRTVNASLNNAKSKYTLELVDFFAVYSTYYNGFFIFPNKGNMQSIRLSLTGKNKVYFSNFEFNCFS